jgi:adenylylsulfate kinase-like enzyme
MNKHGFVVWFTGLPESWKSTLARVLLEALQQQGLRSEILDSDEISLRLTKGLGYSRADWEDNINRIAFVTGLLARVGAVAITAAISPY